MDVEIWVAGEHCGELSLGTVVEDVARDVAGFCVREFIAYSKGRAGALAYHDVALTKP